MELYYPILERYFEIAMVIILLPLLSPTIIILIRIIKAGLGFPAIIYALIYLIIYRKPMDMYAFEMVQANGFLRRTTTRVNLIR